MSFARSFAEELPSFSFLFGIFSETNTKIVMKRPIKIDNADTQYSNSLSEKPFIETRSSSIVIIANKNQRKYNLEGFISFPLISTCSN